MDILKSLTNCRVFSTVSQEEDEAGWLAARSRGIGGSDVGAICGINPWTTARHIYLKKTGQFIDGVDNFDAASKDRMHFGHMLEPIVADEFARRTGKKIAVSPATLQHKEYPWALANVDRLIVDDEGKPYGVLECKTASEYINEDWKEGDIPVYYLYQLQWYLWITGLEYGAIACLVGGNKFYYYEVHLNRELIENEIFPKAERFWNYNCKELVAPMIDGSDAATELLNIVNPPSEVEKNSELFITDDDSYDDLAATVVECKAKIKELEKIMMEATNRLKEKMGTNEIAYTSNHTVKWSPRSQTRLDTTALKTERPDIFAKYAKKSEFRTFTIKSMA